jgi:hypothetical protein
MSYDVEPRINNYPPSLDYGKVFGFRIINSRTGETVRTFLFHEIELAAAYLPVRRRKAFIARYSDAEKRHRKP